MLSGVRSVVDLACIVVEQQVKALRIGSPMLALAYLEEQRFRITAKKSVLNVLGNALRPLKFISWSDAEAQKPLDAATHNLSVDESLLHRTLVRFVAHKLWQLMPISVSLECSGDQVKLFFL